MTVGHWRQAACAPLLVLLAACSTTSVDVTGVAGTPVASTSPGTGATATTAQQIDSAPPCRDFGAAAGTGLPCLGPGRPVDPLALREPTVVAVWASWCEPCRAELPILQQYAAQGGRVLGVDVADTPTAAAALLAELGVTFASVQDPESDTRASLGWIGPPMTYVIADGQVVRRLSGPVSSVAQLRDAVATASGPGASEN